MAYHAAARAAAVELLRGCAADAGVRLQAYRARPAAVKPPCAFVESISSTATAFAAPSIAQHRLTVTLTLVWGLFDSGEAVDQRDRMLDALHDWVRVRPHQMSGASLLGVPMSIDDIPAYTPDWLPGEPRTFFASTVALAAEGTD